MHGSFVLGLGLLVLDALRRRMVWQRAARRFGVGMVAVSLTAHGLGVWSMLGSFLANRDALDFISEWAAPDLLSVAAAPYVLVVLAVLVAAALGRIEARELWVVAPLLVFGLTSARAIMPAAIVLVPFAVSVWRPGSEVEVVAPGPARANLVIAAALIAVPLITLFGFQGLDTDRFPVEAATYLDATQVWHDDATGGYLIYAGRLPVFIDDRAELYGAEFFGEFVEHPSGNSHLAVGFRCVRHSTGVGCQRCWTGRGADCRGVAGRFLGRPLDGLCARLGDSGRRFSSPRENLRGSSRVERIDQ